MKKAKIIVPALAALAFSTVASVTGTVAWFTSQSAVTVSTTDFGVVGLEGALDVNMAAGFGTAEGITTGSGETKRVTSIKAKEIDGKTATLTHGSFNAATKHVYTKNQYGEANDLLDKGQIDGQNTADPATTFAEADAMEDATNYKFNVFTWTITFTLNVADGKSRNLYFDASSSVSYATASDKAGLTEDEGGTAGTAAANAARGFRVAFINGSTAKTVWSPLQKYDMVMTNASSCYATAETGTNTAAYNSTYNTSGVNLIYAGDTEVSKITTQTGGTNRKDYLGTFSSTNSTVTLTCVAWFEGLDSGNVFNETGALPKVSTSMGFYVRNAA